MDDIVKKAIAKWPNVPHCYGWLGLDARGAWRMRDERAQHLGLAGERVVHPALLGFIARNYSADAQGRWFFQNGPQRVYLNLEATPFIVRTDPQAGLILHTGEALGKIEQAFLTDQGTLIVCSGDKVAQLDDRDGAFMLAQLEIDSAPVPDQTLLDWLGGAPAPLTLRVAGQRVELTRIAHEQVARQFGFVRHPEQAAEPEAAQAPDPLSAA